MKAFTFSYRQDADDKGFMAEYDFPLFSKIDSFHNFGEEVAWPPVLEKFLEFLGSAYGYDIKSQVNYPGNDWYKTEDDNA